MGSADEAIATAERTDDLGGRRQKSDDAARGHGADDLWWIGWRSGGQEYGPHGDRAREMRRHRRQRGAKAAIAMADTPKKADAEALASLPSAL